MTGSHSKTRSTSTTTLPTWITDQSKSLINESNDLNSAGYPTYDGDLVAGLNDQEKSAANNQFNNAFSYQPTLNQAGNSVWVGGGAGYADVNYRAIVIGNK